MVEQFAQEPGLLGALLLGSAAAGTCDSASDVDLALYWAEVPERSRLDAIMAAQGAGQRWLFAGSPADGGCVESYQIAGVRHDFAHMTPELWHAETDAVLEELNLDSQWQKGMHGTLHGEVLCGAGLIETLRGRIRVYPQRLQAAMLARYCTFTPLWTIEHQARLRGDLLFYFDMLVRLQTNLLFTLCAVNGVYHAMEFKRLHRFATQELQHAPRGLAARLDRMLHADPREPAPELPALVDETLDLVATHCPDFPLAPVRERWTTAAR